MTPRLTTTSSSCQFDSRLPHPHISRALYDQLVLTAQEEDDQPVHPLSSTETGYVTICYELQEKPEEDGLWERATGSGSGSGSNGEAAWGGARTRTRSRPGRGEKEVVFAQVDLPWEALPNTNLRLPTLPPHWPTPPSLTRPSARSGNPSWNAHQGGIPISITLIQPVPLDRIVLRPIGRQGRGKSKGIESGEPIGGSEEEDDLPGVIERIQANSLDTHSTSTSMSSEPSSSTLPASSSTTAPLQVFRQTEIYTDKTTGREFVVLLTSPVPQGIIQRGRTEIVLVSSLSSNSDQREDPRSGSVGDELEMDADFARGHLDGKIAVHGIMSSFSDVRSNSYSNSESGSSKRRWAVSEKFDPDAFLASSSLLREKLDDDDDDDEDDDADPDSDEGPGQLDEDLDYEGDEHGDYPASCSRDKPRRHSPTSSSTPTSALSVSSGSLTPRPFGSPVLVRQESFSSTHSSVRHRDDVDDDGIDQVDGELDALVGVGGKRPGTPKGEFRGVAFEGVCLARMPKDKRRRIEEEREADEVAGTSKEGWPDEDSRCWLTMDGLARAGVFVGDWVVLKISQGSHEAQARLVQVDVMPVQHDTADDLPEYPIFLSPMLRHRLCGHPTRLSGSTRPTIMLLPIPSGHRTPSLPVAKYITLSRIATPWSVDKRYEDRFTRGLRTHFEQERGVGSRLIKQGDVVAIPILEEVEDSDVGHMPKTIAVVYFAVSYMSYDPLLPLEEDFVMSASSQARAGEFGCWVDVEKTRMMTISVQHGKSVPGIHSWLSIPREPGVFSQALGGRLSNFVTAHLSTSSLGSFNIPLLLTGARGSGKSSLIRRVAEDLGIHVVEVNCFDILDEAPATTEGTLLAQAEKAQNCAPCVLLLRHVEALGRKSTGPRRGKDSPILVKLVTAMQRKTSAPGLPTILIGTATEPDQISEDHMAVFKQELKLEAPSEPERFFILKERVQEMDLAIDVDLKRIARETAALTAIDLANLVDRAQMASVKRLSDLKQHAASAMHIGMPVVNADFENALNKARSSLADAIGAPKIPNVSWDDVGGLADVKSDILDTIQLPLERPELFAEGLKKRSGILLYGPPGTGKTLLAKAVATSCSLNFFSVKGPELLNMYIGESEANVRRVFQKARDAQPCVIFMDELDSIAPKRGNQGDSGGVMDRIVSQLLAELDGMAEGKGGAGVFVMAATNRPDLLDPALLRPGRFDRMLYLSVSTDHKTQYNILSALTRKFNLDPLMDLMAVAERCPFNYTGADFYALCSDAMLKAMSRTASAVDERIAALEVVPEPRAYPKPLTPQYYLSAMAKPEETDVIVTEKDFVSALEELVPSVSLEDIRHYETVRQKFASETLNSERQVNGDTNGHSKSSKGKGKGKAKA